MITFLISAVRVQRVVSSGGNFAYLGVFPVVGVAREHGELHALSLRELGPLQIRE
jgi:hypothetical protein